MKFRLFFRSSFTLFCFTVLYSCSCYAQLNKWIVRETSGQIHLVDFTTPVPTVSYPAPGFGTGPEEDLNIITDSNSRVLFSSVSQGNNTIILRDSNWVTMPNGSGLTGHNSSFASAICPRPCSPKQYYFIHFKTGAGGLDSLFYSVVDMTLNGGSGDVIPTQKNIYIGSSLSEGMAVSHQLKNGCRWLFLTGYSDSTYTVKRFLVSSSGIGSPVSIGTYVMTTIIAGATNDVCLSHDNTKLAISTVNTNPANHDIILWDLNLQAGTLSNQLVFDVSIDAVMGLEFSPDNSKLYFVCNKNTDASDFGRIDFVAWTVDIIDANMGRYIADPELAGNGKLYIGLNYNYTTMACVSNPNSPLIAGLGYSHSAVTISITGCRPSLPNTIDGELPGTAVTPHYIGFSAQSISVCNEFSFQDSSCLGTWWEWDFGDGNFSNSQFPTHQYTSIGTFNVSLKMVACGDTTTLTKPNFINTLINFPQSNFTSSYSPCGDTLHFTNTSSNALTYFWDFGDGFTDTANHPSHWYSLPGNYLVTLIAINPCDSDTIQQTISVNFTPPVSTLFSINKQPCSLTVGLSNQSQNGSSTSWNFGDGLTDTATNPVHTFSSAGIYPITLITSTLCDADTVTQLVDLSDVIFPHSDFSFAVAPCSLSIPIINHSQNSGGYVWNFGDGETDTLPNPVHTYSSSGTFLISLITKSSCGTDTMVKAMTTDIRKGDAEFSVIQSPCESFVEFKSEAVNAGSYLWSFGDGELDSSPNPLHTFSSNGLYRVELIVNEGKVCSDTSFQEILVNHINPSDFYIPNIFSPNDDGLNDRFVISPIGGCDDLTLSVFNRWGEKLFETSDIKNTWDGKIMNTSVPDGTYMYILQGKNFEKTGTVTIIK